jgi:hypothetical protein
VAMHSVTPDGPLLLAVGAPDSLSVVDVATGRSLGDPLEARGRACFTLAFGVKQPEGTVLLAYGGDGGEVLVWAVNCNSPRELEPWCGHGVAAALRPAGVSHAFTPSSSPVTYLACSGGDSSVQVVDMSSCITRLVIRCPAALFSSVAFLDTPGGTVLARSGRGVGVTLWNAMSGTELGPLSCSWNGQVNCISAGSGFLVCGGDDVRVINSGDWSTAWVSRSPAQGLDCAGLKLAGCVGLAPSAHALFQINGGTLRDGYAADLEVPSPSWSLDRLRDYAQGPDRLLGLSALHLAASQGSLPGVQLLLREPFVQDPNAKSPVGWEALLPHDLRLVITHRASDRQLCLRC